MTNAVELATKPVSDAAPAGEWVRYDDDFEALKAEIDKISGVDPNAVEWKKIVELSGDILEKKSKDLLVASYLCIGLLQLQGYASFAGGLEGLAGMISTFWDGLFPQAKRMRARLAAIEWLAERGAASVRQKTPGADEREAVGACLERLGKLDELLTEKLGGDAPSLGELRRALDERKDEMGGPASQAEAAPASPAAAAPAAAAPPPPRTVATPAAEPEDLSSPQEIRKTVNRVLGTMRSSGTALRRADSKDPLAYRLSRIAAWLPMTGLPPHTDGQTRVQPAGASAELVEQWEQLAGQGEYERVLEKAEYQFEQSVFWLDAQRYVAMALENLGQPWGRAREVVIAELAGLLRQYPELVNLRFSNDTPFASPDTQAWIAQEVMASAGAGEAVAPPPPAAAPSAEPEDAEIDEALAQARKLAKKKQIAKAVALLRDLAASGATRRQRFHRRLALARFLVETKEYRLAIAQLEYLDEIIEHFGLEEWEPALALDVLGLFLTCQNQMLRKEWKALPEAAMKAEELLSRVARLDTAAALGIKP